MENTSISFQSAVASLSFLLLFAQGTGAGWVCARLSGLFVFPTDPKYMLTHILQDRTGPLGEQGGTAALVRVTWRGCSSLSKSRQVPQRVIFFFFSLQKLKGKCCNRTLRSWGETRVWRNAFKYKAKGREEQTLSSSIGGYFKAAPKRLGTGKSTVTHQAARHCPPRPPASSAWRANSTIKAVKCHHVISQKLLLSRLGPFDLGLCTYCGVYSGLWLENYKMICIYSRFSAYLSGYLDKLCVLYTN